MLDTRETERDDPFLLQLIKMCCRCPSLWVDSERICIRLLSLSFCLSALSPIVIFLASIGTHLTGSSSCFFSSQSQAILTLVDHRSVPEEPSRYPASRGVNITIGTIAVAMGPTGVCGTEGLGNCGYTLPQSVTLPLTAACGHKHPCPPLNWQQA